MPYIPHLKATAHFTLGYSGAPKEEASCSLHFKPGVDLATWVLSINNGQQLADDCFDDWAAFITSSDARFSGAVQLDYVKLVQIQANGLQLGDSIQSTGSAVRGGLTADEHPWQVSNVISLVADGRGKGRFGRIYLPPQCFTIAHDGLITPSQQATMFAAAGTFLQAISNKGGFDVGFGLAIAGKTGSGTLRSVAEIRMGKVADTQRRRRRSLDEAYSSAGFTP